ncbi:MAG: hypothetical protein WCS70_10585 [Verrucomicrobiota bacterium]
MKKKTERWEDPIVAEVRRVRDQLARKFHYDIHAIFEDLRKRQGKTVSLQELRAGKYPQAMSKPALVRETPPRQRKPR